MKYLIVALLVALSATLIAARAIEDDGKIQTQELAKVLNTVVELGARGMDDGKDESGDGSGDGGDGTEDKLQSMLFNLVMGYFRANYAPLPIVVQKLKEAVQKVEETKADALGIMAMALGALEKKGKPTEEEKQAIGGVMAVFQVTPGFGMCPFAATKFYTDAYINYPAEQPKLRKNECKNMPLAVRNALFAAMTQQPGDAKQTGERVKQMMIKDVKCATMNLLAFYEQNTQLQTALMSESTPARQALFKITSEMGRLRCQAIEDAYAIRETIIMGIKFAQMAKTGPTAPPTDAPTPDPIPNKIELLREIEELLGEMKK